MAWVQPVMIRGKATAGSGSRAWLLGALAALAVLLQRRHRVT
jgi:hypothetical protein